MRRIVGGWAPGGTGRAATGNVRLLSSSTSREAGSGAIRSVQKAVLLASEEEIARLWRPASLERLGRCYWRFLRRVSLGLVRVRYRQDERALALMVGPLRLLGFRAPEYELGERRAAVRWGIVSGLLLARAGRGGPGRLQMTATRQGCEEPGMGSLGLEVEVASFHPAIAAIFGRRLYDLTQSRVHELITSAFLRSLAGRAPADEPPGPGRR